MPKGPKGETHPRDGYEGPPEKTSAAIELSRRAGRKRADTLSAEQRAELQTKQRKSARPKISLLAGVLEARPTPVILGPACRP
jgi:hypothetical protein